MWNKLFLILGLALGGIASATDTAKSASVYGGISSAIISISTASPDGLDSIVYGGSIVSYNSSAQAIHDDIAHVVSSNIPTVTKSGNSTSFGDYFASGKNLRDLLLVPEKPPRVFFPGIEAHQVAADAYANNAHNTPGSSFARFSVDIAGKAGEAVEEAFSSVSWDILIAFQNTSSEQQTVLWAVSYFFSNKATADPNGDAFSQSQFKVQGGVVEGGRPDRNTPIHTVATAACDPRTAKCNYASKPANISKSVIFKYDILPNQTRYFNIYIEAYGNATISAVPVPAALPLFGTGLAIMGFIGWRRRKVAATRH